MTTKQRTAVHFFIEDGFLVRGTLDPHKALALALDDGDPYQFGYACEMAARPEYETEQPTVDEVRDLGDLMHTYLSGAKPGLYRIVPAPPGDDEYSWVMHPVDERGRGVFEGVVFYG
ncbi:hypothetical protein [Kibdelosporangium phytohabitans]|uniref:Uncharacterized protein n=1 Tax=Kibdelosporangium phytohabitans TaxID=860235 RepID=A0A0N9HS00_9PSEU|nr:hypothetical protein [Kibdelosporangium phytohabitans]ALG07634.1 hypothetical protein AOZ06_12605 [Kibdelosporangium phytohabitans]ALG07690.1 hypothetical protein AOZ06_12925 [Kibdelosporangium phytohabitans]MBE1471412.1 hypothetical protein [Kibdelosporangium phytohabitans]